MSFESSLVKLVAVHETASTTAPTAPNKGSSVASWTGWTTFGSVDFDATTCDLESVSLPTTEFEAFRIQAPRSMAPKGAVLLKNGGGQWEFVAAEASEAAVEIASNIGVDTNVASYAGTLTLRTVVIEIYGLGYYYMPSAEVIYMNPPGDNTGTYEQAQFVVVPHATAAVPGGVYKKWYQPAA